MVDEKERELYTLPIDFHFSLVNTVTITHSMAKTTRSSTPPSATRSAGKTGQKRGSTPMGVGGTLVTVLLAVLLWWFNGGAPTSPVPATGDEHAPASTITATAIAGTPTTAAVAAAATATAVTTDRATTTVAPQPEDTDVPTPTMAPPTATSAPPPTATAPPAPTVTKPPKPTPTPTSKARAGPPGIPPITLEDLPSEALDTLALIEDGGPFPFERDGITFQNRERLLPSKPRGYYREYTVITPGENDRGARRIIAGEDGELYYTADHYESFFWIVEP